MELSPKKCSDILGLDRVNRRVDQSLIERSQVFLLLACSPKTVPKGKLVSAP
jgi:hypothetical protein